MPKTRDIAKAKLDHLVQYLQNRQNLRGKTASQLAKELLADIRSLNIRKRGGQFKWGTREQHLELMRDMRLSKAYGNPGDPIPSDRKVAKVLQETYPEKYGHLDQDTLAKQIREHGKRRAFKVTPSRS